MTSPLAPILGVHHITAVAKDAQRNIDFVAGALGAPLVKRTVNFDDPSSLHLYYATGPGPGTPGTALTYFEWPLVAPHRPGTGEVASIALATQRDALREWSLWFMANGIDSSAARPLFGDDRIRLTDPDGLSFELVGSVVSNELPCPLGFHATTLRLRSVAKTRQLLVEIMGFAPLAVEEERERLAGAAPAGTPGRLIDLVEDPDAEPARLGAGGVHHIAFRVPDLAALEAWRDRLRDLGHRVTDVQNRLYFQSIYFREPGGVLFEFATDGPGFAVDEPEDALGTSLKVPPWMEGGAAR